MCCLFSIAAPTQGMNVKGEEMDALGDMLSSAQWTFPEAQEYKNELVQPAFLGVDGVPKSASQNPLRTYKRHRSSLLSPRKSCLKARR